MENKYGVDWRAHFVALSVIRYLEHGYGQEDAERLAEADARTAESIEANRKDNQR